MSLKTSVLICLCSFALTHHVTAQNKPKPSKKLSAESVERIHAAEDTLAILAYAVVNDSIEQERFAACRSLITALVRTLKVENSYKYRFERLRSISILAPPDSSFRIFTWQLYVNDSTYRYYGAIQRNQRDLKLFPLIDRSEEMDELPVYDAISPDKWYGSLYYALRQFDTREGRKYLLMGYDAHTFFERRKVVDVLSFGKDGVPVFGAYVFAAADKEKTTIPIEKFQRLFLEYSAEATVKLNGDDQYKMLMMDHMATAESPSQLMGWTPPKPSAVTISLIRPLFTS